MLGAVLVSGGLLLSLTSPARASQEVTIEYGGLRLPVPAGWQVHHLDREPGRCVRFDRNAIYLGLPVVEPLCPTRLVGRTEALHITPLAGAVPSGERRAAGRKRLAHLVVPETVTKESEVLLPEAGVKITTSYGSRRRLLEETLRAGSIAPGRVSVPLEPLGSPKSPARRAWTTGPGFDTCAAPTLTTMAAWRRSYAVANIYIGGAARGCAQYNLSKTWVRGARRLGYRLIPTYVGLQAPCARMRSRFTAKAAGVEGARAASDAVHRARMLGIPKKRPIYFDMEAYPRNNPKCRAAVLTFLHSWTRRLHSAPLQVGDLQQRGLGHPGRRRGQRDHQAQRDLVRPVGRQGPDPGQPLLPRPLVGHPPEDQAVSGRAHSRNTAGSPSTWTATSSTDSSTDRDLSRALGNETRDSTLVPYPETTD